MPNYGNMFRIPLMMGRIVVIQLPVADRDTILTQFRTFASVTIDRKIANKKDLFRILAAHNTPDDVIMITESDSFLSKRSNARFSTVNHWFSDQSWSRDKPLPIEQPHVVWDLDYDSFKIPGFKTFYSKILILTDKDQEQIPEVLVRRHCYFPRELVADFGE